MAIPLNILIVEDSQNDAELMVEQLRHHGFDPQWRRVETEAEFLAELKKRPDIILSDYWMPQFSGLRAAELSGESGLDIPFILISGTVGEDSAVEAMKHGATDYLMKDGITRLGQAVERVLGQKRLRDERKQAERSLNLFRTLLDRSSDGIEVVDPETGRFLDVNETTCQRLGYTREELLSMKVPEIDITGVTSASWANNVEEIRRTGFKIIEGRDRRKDGSTFPVEINVRYVRLDRDYLIAAVRDITERKKLQAEVVLREQRLNAFFSGATAGLALLDNDLRYLQINETLAEMNGVPVKEHLDRTVREVLPELAPQVEPLLRQVLASGESILNIETSGATPRHPGVARHWLESFFPVLGKEGQPRCVGAIVVETTEHKRVEEGLRDSEEKFRQLAENINEVFWITAPDKHQMLYISPAYERIWGRTCESLYRSPQSWLEAIHPEDRPRIIEAATTKQDRGEYDETYRIVRPDGSVRWIHDCAFPVRNPAGLIYRVVGVAEDITQNRKLEEQFRQSQKLEAFGQLAGGVAHDFNNILAVIQLQAGLLSSEQNLSMNQLAIVSDIEKAAGRGADLTRQLLLFSRKQTMQPRDLNLKDAVANITKMLQRTLGEQIQLQFKLSSELLFLHADPGMIDQILLNLAVNARDAMPKGGQIIVETSAAEFDEAAAAQSPQARPGSFVCLSVSDTGCGIRPEILPRIFEPFFTTKEVGKGTGLGLATVFGIVQQHKGWMHVYSEVERGTTFRVYLPRLTQVPGKRVIWPSVASLCGGNETILLVEDEFAVRATVQTILLRLGYRVLEASTGGEALEIWKQQRGEIRLLLTDLVLPGRMNGKELAEQLLKQDPQLEVIYASGYSAEIAGRNFLLEEGVNFLAKPFETHKLAQTVRHKLDQRGAPKPDNTRKTPGIMKSSDRAKTFGN